MGWLSHALGRSSGGGTRLNLSGSSLPFQVPVPSGKAPNPPKSLVERFNVNDTFDSLSNQGVGLFAAAGQLPSRIMETPVSLVDTAMQRATGFSPVAAVKNTPIGAIGGAIGEGVKRAGNFVPSIINSQDMTVWKAIGDLPDWTPITDSLVEQRLGISGLEGFVKDFNENTGGVPILGAIFGLGTRPKTVGEFREELAKRGMFNDEASGQAIDPTLLVQELRSGKRQTTDFGFAAVNDNALVDFATRMALDPTNALFFVPGAGIAKALSLGGRIGGRIMPAARLAEAGVIAGKAAPVAAKSAEAIVAGNRAGGTLRGLGRVLRGYRTLSIGTAAGNFATNRITGLVNDATGESIPFLREIEEFTAAVENNQPMSGNAAFMLLGAATFPYGQVIVQPIKRATRAARMATVGLDDLAAVRREFGGTEKMNTALGGPDGVQAFADFADVQIARDLYASTPELTQYASLSDLALRRRMEQKALGRIVTRMRERGEITSDMRLQKLKDWHADQAGFADKGVQNPWDPTRAGARWREWMQVRSTIKPLLDETGEAIWGLRDDVVFVEQIDAGRTSLQAATYKGPDGKARVPKAAILEFIEDNPNVNALDKYGTWTKWADEAADDPTWDAVRAKLTGQKRGAVKTSDYFAEAKLWEESAPRDPVAPEGPLGDARPEAIAARAEESRWARDKSVDPEGARAIADGIGAVDEALVPAFVYPGLRGSDPATIARVIDLEREVAAINPSYRVKSIGPKQVLADIPENGAITAALRQRTALGDWLMESSPFSPIAQFMHQLTRPVTRDEMKGGARQALMNDMIPRGFKPTQVNAVLRALEQRVSESVFIDKGSFRANLFRDIGSLLPGQVNRIARRVLVDEAPNPGSATKAAKALAAMERDGGFYRVLSRTSSRYNRSLKAKARTGDKGAKALSTVYDVWTEAPILKDVATGQRVLAKTIYPIFRFLFDPRWLALNLAEGGILAFAKDGYMRAYTDVAQASNAGRFFNARMDPEVLASFSPEIGATLSNKNLQLIGLKSFDRRSAKSIGKIIDELGTTDPAIAALRRNMAREADDLALAASRADDAAEAALLTERAQRLREAGTGSMAEHLNDTLYRFEQDGPEAAVKSEFAKFLDQDEMAAMQPLIERVVDINRQTWNDVQSMLHGNPQRSTLERIGNSYFLYWPLSYQIKATKWLADIMLNGSFGHNNGALLAGKYALWQEQHNERMRVNPQYAALYAANPELWFAAQMILPMGPEDIGISMGRATRLAGERTQSFANSWFKTDIGLFTLNMENERAVPWLTEMGPLYTAELYRRLYSEAENEGFFSPDVPPSAAP